MTDRQLEKTFKLYLSITKGLKSKTVKSYLSDWRRFWQWLKQRLTSSPNQRGLKGKFGWHRSKKTESSADFIISQITPALIRAYQQELLAQKLAQATIKRHLATLRVFCQLAQDQRWLADNPFRKLPPKTQKQSQQKEIDRLVSQFGSWLKRQGVSSNTIKSYTADLRHYLLSQLNQE